MFQKEEIRADFDRKVRENPLNDHLKVVGNVPLDHTTTKIFVDTDRETIRWMYLNPDATSGAQYVSCESAFAVFKELAEKYDIADHPENAGPFGSDLKETSHQTLSDINTPFFLEAQAEYETDADYTEFTSENILNIHERILSYEADRDAMREIDRYEAEFGADGRRVFREKEDPVGSKPVGRIEYLDKKRKRYRKH